MEKKFFKAVESGEAEEVKEILRNNPTKCQPEELPLGWVHSP